MLKKKCLIVISAFFLSLNISQAESRRWTLGAGAEFLPIGELSGTYDFLGDILVQYSLMKRKSFQLFIDSGFTNSFQTGSVYSQLRLGLGARYYYGNLGAFSFFVDGSAALGYSRETFYTQLFNRVVETTFTEVGAVGKVSTGFFIRSRYGMSLFAKQNHNQATSAGLNFLLNF